MIIGWSGAIWCHNEWDTHHLDANWVIMELNEPIGENMDPFGAILTQYQWILSWKDQYWSEMGQDGAIWTTLKRWWGDARIWQHQRELDEYDSILMYRSEYWPIISEYWSILTEIGMNRVPNSDIGGIWSHVRVILALFEWIWGEMELEWVILE